MAVMAVGSARWLARQAELAAAAPACALDAAAHLLVSADDSLRSARALLGDRAEAARWVHAADRDLEQLAALDGAVSDLLEPIAQARAAVTGSLRAPDACFEHAIDAARRSVATTAIATGRSLDDARLGAATCAHPPRDRSMVGDVPGAATATRAYLAHGDLGVDPAIVQGAASARFPDEALDDAQRAIGRVARDELAATFDPAVHDLIEHARALRDVPLERMRRTPFELIVKSAPGPSITHLEYGLPIPADGTVKRVEQVVHEFRPASGNGMQIDLPVGEYGTELALAQAKAAQAMHSVIIERMGSDLADVGRARADLLDGWTFQRRHVTASMLEGVTSIAQATALATQRRLPGMDAFQLLDALADSHVYDRLAKAPIGFMAPIARTGRRIEAPLVTTQSGAVRLGPELDELYRDTLALRHVTGAPSATTRAGCPLALRGRSVTLGDGTVVTYERTLLAELAREYLDLVQRYLRAEPPAPPASVVS